MAELLAKSVRGGRRLTLLQHALDAERAAAELFRTDCRWGRSWYRFFGLGAAEEQERFLLNLRVAALLHDLGKANEDFQAAVAGEDSLPQPLRHEHLGGLALCLPEVRAWLGGCVALDVDGVTAAVLSHHLKVGRSGEHAWCQPTGRSLVPLAFAHPQVVELLERVRTVAGLAAPPQLPVGPWRDSAPWSIAYQQGLARDVRLKLSLMADSYRQAFVAAIKAGVIVADAVASGLFRTERGLADWVEGVAHADGIDGDTLRAAILEPRKVAIRQKTGHDFALHPFQAGAQKIGPRAVLLAGCGMGKTLAAWEWAAAQADERRVSSVLFLYPTRGTATEGFRDYVSWAPEDEAMLLHGAAVYELQAMATNPQEEPRLRQRAYAPSEDDARLFALGLWSRRYFSATVDQFLSFMEHRYDSLCLLPLLADSLVVFDEVHSYDGRMYANLIQFLRAFDVPVLCMTATLPPGRLAELESCGVRAYPNAVERASLPDLAALEGHPRYRLDVVSSSGEAFGPAVAAYRAGLRVLWVVNTVAECQALALRLRAELGPQVLCYHSRFRLQDRQRSHVETVRAFQAGPEDTIRPAFAVTTQVCEMSLDLDADVLISEFAPTSSLVQRFGRANRHLRRGRDYRAHLLAYRPARHLPYAKEELALAEEFLARFAGHDVSQAQLATALSELTLPEPRVDDSARFLHSGLFATQGTLRDIDEGLSAQAVLTSDAPAVAELARRRVPYDGYLLPVPRRRLLDRDRAPTGLPPHVGLVPGEEYDPTLGLLQKDCAP